MGQESSLVTFLELHGLASRRGIAELHGPNARTAPALGESEAVCGSASSLIVESLVQHQGLIYSGLSIRDPLVKQLEVLVERDNGGVGPTRRRHSGLTARRISSAI